MNRNICMVLAAISIFLYTIIGFIGEAIGKWLLAILTIEGASYSENDFLLNVTTYETTLIAAACILTVLALIIFINELWKRKII